MEKYTEFATLMPAMTYSPFVITYDKGVRKWSLTFQLIPEKKVIFTGDEPTKDEIISCLSFTLLPVWMIDVIDIIIHCERNK